MTLHPTVSWAQRAEFIYLTVNVSDITVSTCHLYPSSLPVTPFSFTYQEPTIDLTADRFYFKCKGEKEQNEYECELEFLKPVDVEVGRNDKSTL